MTAEDRFWSKVKKGEGCWLWTSTFRNGYGIFWFNRAFVRAHRFAWRVTNGAIPAGLHVCHHCDNPPCVRPDHLFVGTNADNVADMMRKGRKGRSNCVGDRNGQSKLTRADVIRIRELHRAGMNFSELARRFAVSPWTVAAAVKRTQWSHVV